jgi:hypothetical protein
MIPPKMKKKRETGPLNEFVSFFKRRARKKNKQKIARALHGISPPPKEDSIFLTRERCRV